MSGTAVDPGPVARLRDDVGPEAARGMLDRFLDLLPGRVARLHAAVAAGEAPELRDAALSLSCSATMLGAHRLAAVSERLRGTDVTAAPPALRELERVGQETRQSLVRVRSTLSGPV